VRRISGAPNASASPRVGNGVDGGAGAGDSQNWPNERLNVTLALSLHASHDELRDTLVPVNNRWKVSEALTRHGITPT